MTLTLKHTATPATQGMIDVDANGRVRRFIEKPRDWAGDNTANAGIYICEPPIIAAIPRGFSDFGHDIIPSLLSVGATICGRLAQGYLLDIGTPQAYAQAQVDWNGR